jgi:three-Cys-motif partner protein
MLGEGPMTGGQEQLRAEDDGLPSRGVGRWAETKYRLISLYDRLFSTGMKNKWHRVYIDLYSGGGYAQVRGTDIWLKGSPILAIDVPDAFDRYIFCEDDEDLMHALQRRCQRIAPNADVRYVPGCCDIEIEKICEAIPISSGNNRVLSLCLVDPFDFGFKFATIRRLSQGRRVDFLVLLAVWMDANRAYDHYVDGTNPKLDEALGNTKWRERWKAHPRVRDEFLSFLAEEFALSMTSLGYLKIGPSEMKPIRSDNNVPLYYLALFSKHDRAYKFWDDVLKYSTDQIGLSFEE